MVLSMRRFCLFALVLSLMFTVAACQSEEPLPTAVAPAALPTTLPPTTASTSLPPTHTAVASPTVTATSDRPTSTPQATPTPVIAPNLNIASPAEGAQLLLGQANEVTGFVHSAPGMTIQVGATSFSGWTLATTNAAIDGNTWEAQLVLPNSFSGAATLHVVFLDAGGEIVSRSSIPVEIVPPEETASDYLALSHPLSGGMVVAGHSVFFDGRLQRTNGAQMRLSVLAEGCETEVGYYNLVLYGSTYWYAYLNLPRNVSGPACAQVSTGSPDGEGWLAAQVPIEIRPWGDEEAVSVFIAFPQTGRTRRGGEPLNVEGVAYNAPGGNVNVSVQSEDGRVLGETLVSTDDYGRWATEMLLPADISGEAVVRASIGDAASPRATTETVISVVPGSP
jgi:hypothetical protein